MLEGTSFGRHEAMSESFPELTSYGGNSSTHGKWTHGSAEYKSRKQNTKLASVQVIRKIFDFFSYFFKRLNWVIFARVMALFTLYSTADRVSTFLVS